MLDVKQIRICVDRIVPGGATPPRPHHPMAADRGKLWKPGRRLRVRFLDGAPVQRKKVEAVAHQWEQFANIRFVFGDDPAAEIRISFSEPGSWSAIGTDALSPYFHAKPTMNFGWLRPDTPDTEYSRVVLHEFGHSLGAVHEHQTPAGGIRWNVQAVYEYFAAAPNFWTRADVDENVLKRYAANTTNFTAFDPNSIMLYDYPPELTLDGVGTHSNRVLSACDKAFMRSQYP